MARFIHCHRIGKTALFFLLNGVAAVAIGISLTFFEPAQAQQGFPEFSTYELFPDAESVDPKPDVIRQLADAIRKAQPPGNCPLGRLKIRTPKGDPLFQGALANAREQSVLKSLNSLGVPVAGRLFVESTVFGGSGGHDTVFETPLDRKPPKLTTTSVPPKGSKVKAGDRITVTMVARDDPAPSPTGIKTIQLVADSEGGRFIASENYEPCAEPAERRVVATYTVPQNPPPIVRLTALAEDHARHMDTDVGEFPTGDWYGTFGWTHICAGGGNRDETRGISDLTLDHDGRGNLTGRLTGSTPERTQIMPTCSFRYVAPGTFSAKLVGSYTSGQDTFSAQAVEVQTTPGRASWACPAGTTVTDQPFFSVYEGPMFRDAFRDLRRQPDGSRKSSGENTFSAGASSCTTTYSLTLRQAQN